MPDLRMMANTIREFREEELFRKKFYPHTEGPADSERDEELLTEALIDMLRKATFILEEAQCVNHAEMQLSDFEESMRKEYRDEKFFDKIGTTLCERIHTHWRTRRITQANAEPAVHFPRVNDYTNCASRKEIYNIPFVEREGVEFEKLQRLKKTTSVPHYVAKQQAASVKKQLLEEFMQKIDRLREFLDLIYLREREKQNLSLEDMYLLARARSAFEQG
ncbi:hypothetical protein XU18_1182 [Perkinsela sp. CCAP 1560/4]|nr:hypothetical protein XU18_1182 [Perkinsela sp. CCAP 1560/4]|eukprot:KNH08281.1 hypothetical protein XU18_1182 [Perkinsela sp. CCAP 1560/4]